MDQAYLCISNALKILAISYVCGTHLIKNMQPCKTIWEMEAVKRFLFCVCVCVFFLSKLLTALKIQVYFKPITLTWMQSGTGGISEFFHP